ncbi:hypothetical protein [Jeotgalibacillus sp. R-1-5s-1]|uniref:hypothetical protein n=1 Tax=Jeotgalibacillus sp. R-1-5s-1 TaxID=2555897 RepID=UPI00106A65EA|nr:hypothetical protein [Jeotgalibacillus sp. R-1-5s-1]TFE03600.1 hypothetical protein E2491_02090 [Jeotgalibacillus sp. R-1-5s-1]
MFILSFIVVAILLVLYFIPTKETEPVCVDDKWLVPAIISALVAYGIIEAVKEEEWEGISLENLEYELGLLGYSAPLHELLDQYENTYPVKFDLFGSQFDG